jgi:hypothetical protein
MVLQMLLSCEHLIAFAALIRQQVRHDQLLELIIAYEMKRCGLHRVRIDELRQSGVKDGIGRWFGLSERFQSSLGLFQTTDSLDPQWI